jgi:hypothetical protein
MKTNTRTRRGQSWQVGLEEKEEAVAVQAALSVDVLGRCAHQAAGVAQAMIQGAAPLSGGNADSGLIASIEP